MGDWAKAGSHDLGGLFQILFGSVVLCGRGGDTAGVPLAPHQSGGLFWVQEHHNAAPSQHLLTCAWPALGHELKGSIPKEALIKS